MGLVLERVTGTKMMKISCVAIADNSKCYLGLAKSLLNIPFIKQCSFPGKCRRCKHDF